MTKYDLTLEDLAEELESSLFATKIALACDNWLDDHWDVRSKNEFGIAAEFAPFISEMLEKEGKKDNYTKAIQSLQRICSGDLSYNDMGIEAGDILEELREAE